MSAYIIGVCNFKGGCGKTTTSFNLASALKEQGHRVLLVDADHQNTAVKLASRMPDERSAELSVMNLAASGKKLVSMIQSYRHAYDYIIVDSPPNEDAPQNAGVISSADLLLIPTSPSIFELEASAVTAAAIRREGKVRSLLAAVVLNRTNNTRVHRAGISECERLIGFPVLPVALRQRTAYQEMALLGGSVLDSSDLEAAKDVRLLSVAVTHIREKGRLPKFSLPSEEA